MDDNEKTHDPTPHRRQQAREEGQVVHSQDLAAAILLLTALIVLLNLGGSVAEYFAGMGKEHWGAKRGPVMIQPLFKKTGGTP